MYYLETRETKISGCKPSATWKPVCYSARREPLDEMIEALGAENYRVTLGVERRTA